MSGSAGDGEAMPSSGLDAVDRMMNQMSKELAGKEKDMRDLNSMLRARAKELEEVSNKLTQLESVNRAKDLRIEQLGNDLEHEKKLLQRRNAALADAQAKIRVLEQQIQRDSKPGGGGAADKLKEQLDKMTYELSVALQEKEAAVENEASLQARLARVNEAHQEAVQGRAQAEGKAEELRQSLLRMTEARELHRNRVTSLEEMLSYLDTYMSMVPPSHRPKISLEEYAMNNRPEDAARPTSSAAARGLQRTGSKNLARGKVPSNGEPLSRAASMRASGGSGNSQDKAMAPSATTGRTRAASEAATAPGRTSAAEPADGNPVYSVGAADYTQKKKTVAAHQVPPRRRATHAAEQPHPAPVKELSRVDEESAMQAKASQRNMSFRVKPDPDGVQEQRDALRRVLSKKISSRGLH